MAKNAIMANFKLFIHELLKFAADSDHFSFRVTKGLILSTLGGEGYFVTKLALHLLNQQKIFDFFIPNMTNF
jgi:hypothetical protein